MARVGQRWLWEKPGESKFIVEVLQVEPTLVEIKQVFSSDIYHVGEKYTWDIDTYDQSYWIFLEDQHNPG